MTLEWGDGTKVVITRHVYAVRRPEKLLMEPADTAELHNPTFAIPKGANPIWNPSLSDLDEIKEAEKHDKIQGDANNPWTVNDDGSPTP